MGKTGLASASLVAAIPGGFLTVMMVLAFVNYTGDKPQGVETPILLFVVAGVTLAVSFLVMLMPVGIFVFSPKTEEAETETDEEESAQDESAAAVEPVDSDEEELPKAEDADVLDMDDETGLRADGFETDDLDKEADGLEIAESDEDIFEMDGDDLDGFDMDDFEEEPSSPVR